MATNHLAGWHHKLNKLLMKAHPNIYEILHMFKNGQASNEMKMFQLLRKKVIQGIAKQPREKRKC